MSEEEEIIKELEEKYIFNEPIGGNLLDLHRFEVDGIIYNSTIPNNQLIGITEYQYAKFMQLQNRIDKAIEYIKELQNSCLVFSNIAYKELLEILGDKENE